MRNLKPRECKKCGEKYIPSHTWQKYCENCAYKKKKHFCLFCGKEIHFEYHRYRFRFCTEKCNALFQSLPLTEKLKRIKEERKRGERND